MAIVEWMHRTYLLGSELFAESFWVHVSATQHQVNRTNTLHEASFWKHSLFCSNSGSEVKRVNIGWGIVSSRLVACKMRHRYLTHHKFHFGHPLCHSYAFVASRRPNREKIETSDLHFYFTLTFWLKLNAFELDVAWRKDSKGVQFQLIPLSVHFVVSFGQQSSSVELQIFPFALCLFLLARRKGEGKKRGVLMCCRADVLSK